MEESQKVRQLTQKEVSQIDANQVAYYTLTDGTIIRIKKDDENAEAGQSQNEQQFVAQNQSSGVQEQALAQNENESPVKYQENQNTMEANQINQQEQITLSNQYQDQGHLHKLHEKLCKHPETFPSFPSSHRYMYHPLQRVLHIM